MTGIADALSRITKWGALVGGFFLIVGMLLLVGNILGRVAHFVIPGSYEMFELFMALPVAFGLVYAALHKGHVVVHLLVSRLTFKVKAVAEMFASMLSFATWALIAYAGARLAIENGLQEISETIGMPYMPFRLVWVFCLLLFSMAYLVDFSNTLKKVIKK